MAWKDPVPPRWQGGLTRPKPDWINGVAALPHRAQPNATMPIASSIIRSWVPVMTWSAHTAHTRASAAPGRCLLRATDVAIPNATMAVLGRGSVAS